MCLVRRADWRVEDMVAVGTKVCVTSITYAVTKVSRCSYLITYFLSHQVSRMATARTGIVTVSLLPAYHCGPKVYPETFDKCSVTEVL